MGQDVGKYFKEEILIMSKSKHPLDSAFDIDFETETLMDDPEFVTVKIPEDQESRDLNLVIERALIEYADIKNMMHLIEPKSRIKYFEMARDFLTIAKDARYKLDYLNQKKATPKKNSDQKPLTDEPQEGYSREELENQVRQLKAVK